MEISGVAAIVTGGGSGLGRATAGMLANRGAKVTIFDLSPETGEAAASDIGAFHRWVDVADDAGAAPEPARPARRICAACVVNHREPDAQG